MKRSLTRIFGLALCIAGLVLLAIDVRPAARGQNAPDKPEAPAAAPKTDRAQGRLIHVPLPIVGNADNLVKRAVQRALADLSKLEGRPILVFEFSSKQNQTGQGSDFARSLSLARYLSSREVSSARTVAYIPQTLKGHAVLVAMACEEIVMTPEGRIGEASIDEPAEETIDRTMLAGYQEIANRRRTIPAQVALGMLDKHVEVLKVETEVSPEFVLRSELDELKKNHTIQSEKVLKRAGQLAQFSGREARELGFVKYLAADRASLARALELPATALDQDPSLAGDWRPVRLAIKGPINGAMMTRTQRMIEDHVRKGANFFCLWIDSPGGSMADSITMATFLADLDPGTIRTVAYVPSEARADAAIIALACDQLVMHPTAVLGGPGAEEFSEEEVELARTTIQEVIAPKKARNWSLIAAMIDSELRVFKYTSRDNGLVEYFSEPELQAQANPDAWTRGEEVAKAGQPLTLNGETAHELNLARHTVQNFAGFKQTYALENELAQGEPGWADYFIDALAQPAIAWLLLLIGGAALYAELQAPGIGVGGFIAGICFLLYFWSKHLDGTAGWLEVLLFAAGVTCIMLELFVLPGTAIFGLGGGALVIISLVLASQTFVLPRNDYQVTQLRDSLLGLIAVGVGIVAAAMVMRRVLPHTPLLSNMMLEPPSNAELEVLSHREALADFEHLLGHHGHATTQLTPSGKARFGQQLVDVIADGEVVGRGSEVVVIGVQGTRVVVRSVTGRA